MTHRPLHPRGRRILDRFSVKDIPKSKGQFRLRQQFEWELYSELAFQRSQIMEELKKSLLDQAEGPFNIERWQRAVKFRYAFSPLSARGSLNVPGGRFNIGLNDTRFADFPALYMAKSQETALDELLSRNAKGELLSPEELALTHKQSIAVVAINGELGSVIDLREEKRLTNFIELTGHFKLSNKLKAMANQLQLDPPRLLGTAAELKESLLGPNWRFLPMQMDIPANSQIFGQIAKEAGINAILYPSVLSKEDCLAIFPQTFATGQSWLEIADYTPEVISLRKLDGKTTADAI